MCDKSVDTCHFVLDPVPDQYMTHEMCDNVVSKEPFNAKILSWYIQNPKNV